MTQIINSDQLVPLVKTISLACAAIQTCISSSTDKVVLLVTTHRIHTATILGCYLAFQGYCKTSFEGFKMVYDFWNVKQLSSLKPDSSRLVGLAIVPTIIRTMTTFDELLGLRSVQGGLDLFPLKKR